MEIKERAGGGGRKANLSEERRREEEGEEKNLAAIRLYTKYKPSRLELKD